METKLIVAKSTVERAADNIKSLKLNVPNSFSYGMSKAFDLFGSSYHHGQLIWNVNKLGPRSGRRKLAVYRKRIKDWRVIQADIAYIANVSFGTIEIPCNAELKKEKYGKRRAELSRKHFAR